MPKENGACKDALLSGDLESPSVKILLFDEGKWPRQKYFRNFGEIKELSFSDDIDSMIQPNLNQNYIEPNPIRDVIVQHDRSQPK